MVLAGTVKKTPLLGLLVYKIVQYAVKSNSSSADLMV